MKVLLYEGDEAYDLLKTEIKNIVKSALSEIISESTKNLEKVRSDDEWISKIEAMRILKIKGSSKMQEIRDNSPLNGILISKVGGIYLYYKPSLLKFLEKNIIR